MPLDNSQQKWLPMGLNPQNIATGSSCPGIPFQELGKVHAVEHQFRYPFKALLSSYEQQSCGKQVSCLNRQSNCDAAPERASQKRFLVFDQSGNQTRLLQYGFPLRVPSSLAGEQGKILNSLNPEKGLSTAHAIPEDDVNGEEESEMHEDTEEINALLYSDDEDYNDDYESDDEVMSTGHSPFPVEQQACNKTTEEELDETESCHDGPRLKRQKVLDHSYSDLSVTFVGTKSSTKLKESSDEMGSGLSEEQSRKDKIHTALRILESVVPGAKGKEALLLLDEAIDYLKLLKRNLNSPNPFY